jgi:NTP pyrophosphatase (non-canonical NTP hydrolase)
MRWGNSFADANDERIRAHKKHAASGQSAEQMPWSNPLWLPILVEEVGEVARALCDHEPLGRLRAEVIQVAAMALAYADAIQEQMEAEVREP